MKKIFSTKKQNLYRISQLYKKSDDQGVAQLVNFETQNIT